MSERIVIALILFIVLFPIDGAIAEIVVYDARGRCVGEYLGASSFRFPRSAKTFDMDSRSGHISFSPYYFKEERCEGEPYTMLPTNRVARGPDGKLHCGSSPLVQFNPKSYLNDRNKCVNIEAGEWTDSFSEPEKVPGEVSISFPVTFPLTYKYVGAGFLQNMMVHSGTPAQTRRDPRRSPRRNPRRSR